MDALTERGLARRLKRYVYKATHVFSVSTDNGLEEILASEIRDLGLPVVAQRPGWVDTQGPFDLVYRLNWQLRCARRVSLSLGQWSSVKTLGDLYNGASALAWERFLGFAEGVQVTAALRRSPMNHSGKAEDTVYKALSNRMRQLGLSPKRTDKAALHIHLRVFEDQAQVLLDSTGPSLDQRPYLEDRNWNKRDVTRPTLAAALLRKVGADQFRVVFDPFCGRGTLILEQALKNRGRPANAGRDFAFQDWPAYKEAHLRQAQKADLKADLKTGGKQQFFMSDRKLGALRAARKHAKGCDLESVIKFESLDFKDIAQHPACGQKQGLLVAHPSFGHLRDKGRDPKLEKRLRELIPKHFGGWTVALLVPWAENLTDLVLEDRQELALREGKHGLVFVTGRVPTSKV